MTPQQKKSLWICLGLLGLAYVGRSAIDSARQAAFYRQQAIRVAQQQAYAKAHPAPPPAPVVNGLQRPKDAAITPVVLDAFSGLWRGSTPVLGRGICGLKLEIHEDTPGHYTGYSTLSCYGYAPIMTREERSPKVYSLNRLTPAAAILSGAVQTGVLHLIVDKTLTTNSNGCAATSFQLTPFSKQMAVDWEEGTCQGGRMLMGRSKQ